MKTQSPPNIYDFKTSLSYLEAWFQFKALQDPEYSLRKWAKELGFHSSDVLFDIMKEKKNITPKVAEIFIRNFSLDASEEKYFNILIKIGKGILSSDLAIYELMLSEVAQLHGSKAYVEDQSVFSHWVHMAILTMSRIKGIACNKNTIKDYLNEEVSQEIIDEAVDRLIRLGLMDYDQNGTLQRVQEHTTSKNDAFTKSPHQYFEQVSDLAKKAASLPAQEREFQCFSLAINHAQIPDFKEAIRNFRGKLSTFADVKNSNQVYQVNLQFFPLTPQVSMDVQSSSRIADRSMSLGEA